MKVHQIPKQHPMAAIAETHAIPIESAAKGLTVPKSDKLAGILLAEQVLALSQEQTKPWQAVAIALMESTTEVRASFLSALTSRVKTIRDEQTATGIEAKVSNATIASATVYLSKLRTLARAFNGGGTIRGFVTWVNKQGGKGLTLDGWRNASWHLACKYAQTFGGGKAGRPADNLLVRMGKWLDAQAEREMTAAEKAVFKDARAFYTKETEAHPSLLPADKSGD